MEPAKLTLFEAISSRRLSDFIAQEEARGGGKPQRIITISRRPSFEVPTTGAI